MRRRRWRQTWPSDFYFHAADWDKSSQVVSHDTVKSLSSWLIIIAPGRLTLTEY